MIKHVVKDTHTHIPTNTFVFFLHQLLHRNCMQHIVQMHNDDTYRNDFLLIHSMEISESLLGKKARKKNTAQLTSNNQCINVRKKIKWYHFPPIQLMIPFWLSDMNGSITCLSVCARARKNKHTYSTIIRHYTRDATQLSNVRDELFREFLCYTGKHHVYHVYLLNLCACFNTNAIQVAIQGAI